EAAVEPRSIGHWQFGERPIAVDQVLPDVRAGPARGHVFRQRDAVLQWVPMFEDAVDIDQAGHLRTPQQALLLTRGSAIPLYALSPVTWPGSFFIWSAT